jgi:hypothetical protein
MLLGIVPRHKLVKRAISAVEKENRQIGIVAGGSNRVLELVRLMGSNADLRT